jgi:mannobiose 2-epimerase
MNTKARIAILGLAAETELRDGMLPFWTTEAVDRENGGFFGRIDEHGRPDPSAGKGLVLNARILWSFSAVLRRWPDPIVREVSDRAFRYLVDHFLDPENSGLFWEVDSEGRELQGRKQTYGQAFGIYGLAEYFRATGTRAAIELAERLFEDIEAHALDSVSGGYWEARERGWEPIDDIRLSPIDMNAPFSMNTHLHLLEAYTCLVLASDKPRPRNRLRAVLEIMLDQIIDPETGHLILFHDERWRPMSSVVSYGHEIEASWLLCEAAEVVGDATLVERAKAVAMRLAESVLSAGYDRVAGGIYYELSAGRELDTQKHWWVQAEGIVGFLNAYQLSGRGEFLDAALKTWEFIDAHVIDRTLGEWHNRVTAQGEPIPALNLVDFWKCPYHNTRAMLEISERTRTLAGRDHGRDHGPESGGAAS